MFIVTVLTTNVVQARENFLDDWRDKYPESFSGDINCQLCHQSSFGGNPWNAYGWDIHLEYNQNGFDLAAAFEAVEAFDSDEDGTNNIDEITANEQPGWLLGNVNTAYNCIGDACEILFTEDNFHPPTSVDPHRDKLVTNNYSIEYDVLAQEFYKPITAVTSGAAGHNDFLFVVDQVGIIWRVNVSDGSKEIYIDIRKNIKQPSDLEDERGLIGYVFHPNFVANGLVYIASSQENSALVVSNFSTLEANDVADHQMVITEFTISNPLEFEGPALIESSRNIMVLEQPQENNNGGGLAFGHDGFLYISVGDGGGADDQGVGHGLSGNGQNTTNPYAAILRIDPHGIEFNNGRYGIPSDNPFINDDAVLNEIYAYGFRNPGNMSFNANGELFASDQGENHVEEINKITLGGNYGWSLREGPFFFLPNNDRRGLVSILTPEDYPRSPEKLDPLFSYDRDEGQSVVGGYYYSGSKYDDWNNKYIFADVNGRLFVGDPQLETIESHNEQSSLSLHGMAIDQRNNLYLLGLGEGELDQALGTVLKIESTEQPTNEICLPVMSKNKKISLICL